MYWFKKILTILVAVAIITAGIPAQAAKPKVPMAEKISMQQMDMSGMQMDMPCHDFAKMAQQMPLKNKCCDDQGCNAKCSALSGAVTAFYMPEITFLKAVKAEAGYTLADTSFSSSPHYSQDRPPKYLS